MKKLLIASLISSSLFANFTPDVYITKRLPEDKAWREKIKPLFFEHPPMPSLFTFIKKKINHYLSRDKKIEDDRRTRVREKAIQEYGGNEVTLKTEDGFKLAALHYEREDAPVNIIYATGYFEQNTPLKEWCAPFAALFPSFNIMSFDWRAYGDSTGNPRYEFGTNAYKDIHAAIKYIRERNDKPIVLVGFCMGGAIALHSVLEAQKIEKYVPDALVLDCPFKSFMGILSRVEQDPDVSLIQWLILKNTWLLHLRAWQFDGNLLDLKPVEMVKDLKIPLNVVHSTADRMVPIEEGIEVFNNANVPKMFTKSEIGRHVRTYTSVPSQYRKSFYKFLTIADLITNEQVEELLSKESLG